MLYIKILIVLLCVIPPPQLPKPSPHLARLLIVDQLVQRKACEVAGIPSSDPEMTSQQPQLPSAVVPPQLAQNSLAQQAQPHIHANQLDSSQSGAAVGPLDHRALTDRPGCSSVALSAGEVANRNASASHPDSWLSRRDGGFEPWPEEAEDNSHGLYSLHRMFDIVGAQLTHRDVRVLSFLFVDVIDEYERGGIRSGRDFLLALERQGRCDETNFRHVLQLLRIITRHDLLPYVTLKKRQTGEYSKTQDRLTFCCI